jgi:Rieske Fe-S protein
VQCEYLVISTHVPLMGKTGLVSATLFQTKIYPYSSYVIGATLPKGRLPEASFWDTSDPYYYLRVDAGKKSDYVIFGGKDHKTGQETDTEERFQELAQTLVEFLPEAKPERRWSGQVIETSDGLPYMGETAKGQFAASGYSGNGMTFGTLAGMMARDAALGRSNPWHQLFSVNRKAVRGAWEYVKENFDYPYYFVRDRLAGTEGDSTRDVRRGDGKVINLDGQRVACSRDDEGNLRALSAVCTHLGCLVRWNGAEQTWDCPCHGSRFRPNGEVLAGPAEEPLQPVELSTKRKAANGQNGTGRHRDSSGRRAGPRSAGRRSRRT